MTKLNLEISWSGYEIKEQFLLIWKFTLVDLQNDNYVFSTF